MISRALTTLALTGLSQGLATRQAEPEQIQAVDNDALKQFIHEEYNGGVVDSLSEYIRLPNLSPMYDANWNENGALRQGLELMEAWAVSMGVEGLTTHIYDNFTQADGSPVPPIMLAFIDGTVDNSDTAFLYGHADKQPMMEDVWTVTHPMEPLLTENNTRLYGRGVADDAYAFFSSILAVKGLQRQNIPHPRVVIMAETEEESGSPNLIPFLEFMKNELNIAPSFMSIMDSGGHDAEHFWSTTSLRGIVLGLLRVDITDGVVHAGSAGGIVPSPMRIIMDLIGSRMEDFKTGIMTAAPVLGEPVADYQRESALALAAEVGSSLYDTMGFVEGASPNYDGSTPSTEELAEIIIQNTLLSQLTIVAFNLETKPGLGDGAQAIYPFAEVELSIRTAPGIDPITAIAELKTLLEADSPYGAKVTYEPMLTIPSFNTPEAPRWVSSTLEKTAPFYWDGAPAMSMAVGGTVPMMGYFEQVFGELDVLATGVLTGASGHHGPNEFLHIPTAERVTAMISNILAAQFNKDSF